MKLTLCPKKIICIRAEKTVIYCSCPEPTNLEDGGIYTVTQKEVVRKWPLRNNSVQPIQNIRLWPEETKITRNKGAFKLDFNGIVSIWKPEICDIILFGPKTVVFVPIDTEYRV